MKHIIQTLIFSFSVIFSFYAQDKNSTANQNFYNFKAKSIEGKEINMSQYKGKVVLIVNTASKCGFTPQYEGLETLYKKFESKGLVILGFPCNQFMSQEPGNEADIAKFCSNKYNVTFQMFSKIEVNGENTHPLYKFLKSVLGGTMGDDIKWNFTKFLLDRNGKPIKRFAPTVKPEEITGDIEKLLAQK